MRPTERPRSLACCVQLLGQTKVNDLDAAVSIQQHVPALEIAMHEALGVQRLHGQHDLRSHNGRELFREATRRIRALASVGAHALVQRSAVNVLQEEAVALGVRGDRCERATEEGVANGLQDALLDRQAL